MIITVASGKGGTGKTTVATNLAVSIADQLPLHFLDCDVEQPNAHLFLRPEMAHSGPATTPVPTVDQEKCTFCGKCSEICRFKAIAVLAGTTVLTFPEMCHSCGGCMAVCPENAVTETTRELGTLEKGRCGNMAFTHGRLRVGEAMAPPMIRQVRASVEPGRTVIIDAPPGTSCPVISAMKGTDFILLVTEPTPFGLHDLKLAVGAVKILGIPAGLVINRSDLGDDAVETYAADAGLPVLMTLPFDRKIAEAYSRGEMIVAAMPEWRDRFLHLYSQIQAIVNETENRR
jgi:MinD superfamily P-loop ATPase